jgi:uncharacterized protein YjdB
MTNRNRHPLLVAALALAAAACDNTPYDASELVATVNVAPDTATLEVGATRLLAVVIREQDGTPIHGFDVTWSSDNEAIARVAANGTVTAVAEGVTRVSASVAGRSARATISVTQAPLATLEIHGDSVRVLERTHSLQLIAWGRDAAGNALNGVLPTWTSSDPDAVWASNTGGIVAYRGGTVTITAMFQGKSASVRIRVPTVTLVKVLTSSVTLEDSGTAQAAAEVHTEAGVRPLPVQWASENPEIVRINATGTITALRPGTAVIRATVEGVAGRALVTVSGERQPLRGVTVAGQALPVALRDATWTDGAGNEQTGGLVLSGAELQLMSNGRYAQRSFVHYTQDGVIRAWTTIEDVGAVYYDFMTGNMILRSDRYPGRESRGDFEYANGFPTGNIVVTHRVGDDGEAVAVKYQQ